MQVRPYQLSSIGHQFSHATLTRSFAPPRLCGADRHAASARTAASATSPGSGPVWLVRRLRVGCGGPRGTLERGTGGAQQEPKWRPAPEIGLAPLSLERWLAPVSPPEAVHHAPAWPLSAAHHAKGPEVPAQSAPPVGGREDGT